jgi:hypothetical protein
MGDAFISHGGRWKTGKNLNKKRPLLRSRLTRKDNIKLDLKEIAFRCMDWINLSQMYQWRTLTNTVMK